jgi:hypothetical protein
VIAFLAPQSARGWKFSRVRMSGADKISFHSRNRSALHWVRSNVPENCNKTSKRPERSALRPKESWTAYWMMFAVQNWSRTVCCSQTVKHMSTFPGTLPLQLLKIRSRKVKDIHQAGFLRLHTVPSLNSSKRSTIFFWPKHLRHLPAIVPTHAAKSGMNTNPMGLPSPRTQKRCIPSLPVRPTRRGSCPLRRENTPRNQR